MSKIKVVLTTGDVDGIGLEVTAKALNHLGPQRNVQFILWRAKEAFKSPNKKYLDLIDKKWTRVTVQSLEEALTLNGPNLIDIASDLSPAHWVEESAKACLKKTVSGIATAPLSKVTIQEAGFKDLGHTDILKRISKTKDVHMGFVGEKFNVVLATGHIPIKKVSETINFKVLTSALQNVDKLRQSLPNSVQKKPIGILGLNPHAGEDGLIGEEEIHIFKKLNLWCKKLKIPIEGPLVPDAAFFSSNWNRYSVFLALYHDQGLIPFKMIHGQDSGVHISLGIPFVRTSVDHGTAKDIFGKNKANPNSMIDAVRWAIKLARHTNP